MDRLKKGTDELKKQSLEGEADVEDRCGPKRRNERMRVFPLKCPCPCVSLKRANVWKEEKKEWEGPRKRGVALLSIPKLLLEVLSPPFSATKQDRPGWSRGQGRLWLLRNVYVWSTERLKWAQSSRLKVKLRLRS
ncbi:uncharacterized [Tachysurus ichikawai]